MEANHFQKAGVLAVLVVCICIGAWEAYWRGKGFGISYDDGKELWADKRARVYQSRAKATVFIGSSRIKYAIDLATWKDITGEEAVQLAIEGHSPLPVLHDLATDTAFRGKLVVEVYEGLFFSTEPVAIEVPANQAAWYHKETPAEKASFQINRLLESQLVFLDRSNFSTNALLDNLYAARRRVGGLTIPLPPELDRVNFGRQSFMMNRVAEDTNLQQRIKAVWQYYVTLPWQPPITGVRLDSLLHAVIVDVNRIEERGGSVAFVRTPSSGPMLEAELKNYPREQYWQHLLKLSGRPGFHFLDDSVTAGIICPEWSHVKPSDARLFTKRLVAILQEKMGWSFSH